MSLDYSYFYDFNSEIPLKDWVFIKEDGKSFTAKHEAETAGGLFLFLCPVICSAADHSFACIRSVTCNGTQTFFDGRTPYIAYARARQGIEIVLPAGRTEILLEGSCGTDPSWKQFVSADLAQPASAVGIPEKYQKSCEFPVRQYQVKKRTIDLTGYRSGIGTQISPGRFGYSKGDGILDCAMSALGNIDKLYLLGHPEYKKNFRWNYSTLPEGAARHGNFPTANHGIEGDKIEVNHLSVRWGTEFNGKDFSCTYSLATPGIITENASGTMRLSDLEFAGNYQYVMIPRPGGKLEVSTIRDVRDLTMGENYLLLFGCTEFPDLPLLLVFQKQPSGMTVKFQERTHRLSEIIFSNCFLLITATPFGFESFDPIQPDDTSFLERAADRCRFWSRAMLAYPVRCEEYYRNDVKTKTTTIVQKFSYRIIKDEWNTEPLELAPLPPVCTLDGNTQSEDQEDFRFPTKFGYLQGAFGDTSGYTLPWMPAARKFPLKESRSSKISDLLKQGMENYFKFEELFPASVQSYPYAGALMEPFALASTQMQFMEDTDREKIRKILTERLAMACQEDLSYDYPLLDHAYMMKTMPEDDEVVKYFSTLPRKRLFNWYERFEPFTGITFTVCYLNVCFLADGAFKDGSKEEIRNSKLPLAENDWGVGLTFYYMYLSALAIGSFKEIRKHWKLLNSVFSFFEKMHDWACMGTGYSDNAILWVEGANYGAFTSFINMAKAIGDEEAWHRGQYLAAKQFSLRSAIFRASSHYFCKYYGVAPWHTAKIFEEEQNPAWQHMSVPMDMDDLRMRDDGVYNLTTEGIYPEIFEGFRDLIPEDTTTVMEKLRKYLRRMPANTDKIWHFTQQAASLMSYMALTPGYSTEELKEEIQLAREKLCWMGRWRGIHIFSRRLPENFFESLLLAWDSMKKHPIWLEHWQEVMIDSAEWNGREAVVRFRLSSENGGIPLIRFGIRRAPSSLTLNGKAAAGQVCDDILEIPVKEAGELCICMQESR